MLPVLAFEPTPCKGSNEKHKMTIKDLSELKDFFKTDDKTIITAAKVRALRIVAKQITDCDLQELLRNLAYFLEFTGCEERKNFLGCSVIDIRPCEKFLAGFQSAQYSIEVILDCKPGTCSFHVTTERQDWTWTRPRINEKSLSVMLNQAQEFSARMIRINKLDARG